MEYGRYGFVAGFFYGIQTDETKRVLQLRIMSSIHQGWLMDDSTINQQVFKARENMEVGCGK